MVNLYWTVVDHQNKYLQSIELINSQFTKYNLHYPI